MHLELVELLRCTVSHEDSVLVAAADRVENRYIEQGLLGCPVCGAEYPIVDGVTQFAPFQPDGLHQNAVDENAMALAAQLGLNENRGTYALIGYATLMASELRAFVPARMFVVNPPNVAMSFVRLRESLALAPLGIISAVQLPFAPAKLDGIAIAPNFAHHAERAVQLLRVRGRLVAPVATPLPAHMRELVRDDSVWVAEREAVVSAPIALRRNA